MGNNSEKQEWIEIASVIVNLVFKIIMPAIVDLIMAFKKANISLEDIKALASMVERPETFFVEAKSESEQGGTADVQPK